MAVTARLGITLVEESQSQKAITLNAAITSLDTNAVLIGIANNGNIGINRTPAHSLDVEKVTAGSATITYAAQPASASRMYWTANQTPNSGLRGLHIQKKSDNADPVGITLEHDTGAKWDTCALDYTTDDLVLAYSHTLKADNLRLRPDSGQMSFGRVVGQPAIGGAQVQLASGTGKSITGITQATSAVVTVGTSHGFRVGDTVRFANVGGMTQMNSQVGTVTAISDTTITTNIDSSGFSAYTSGGQAYVSIAGISITTYGNEFNFLLLQGVSSGTKRTKIQFTDGSGPAGFQMGTDSAQNGTADFWLFNNTSSDFSLTIGTNDQVVLGSGHANSEVKLKGKLGFFNTAAAAKQTVTGSRGGNAALASLLTALATYGLVTDSSTA